MEGMAVPEVANTSAKRRAFARRACTYASVGLVFERGELRSPPDAGREAKMLAAKRVLVSIVEHVHSAWDEWVESSGEGGAGSWPAQGVVEGWAQQAVDDAYDWLVPSPGWAKPAFVSDTVSKLTLTVCAPSVLMDRLLFCPTSPETDRSVWEKGLAKLIEHQLRHVAKEYKTWQTESAKKATPGSGQTPVGVEKHVKDVLLSRIYLRMPDPVEGQSIVYDDLEYDLVPQDAPVKLKVHGLHRSLGYLLGKNDEVLTQVVSFLGERNKRKDFEVEVTLKPTKKVIEDVDAFVSHSPLVRAVAFFAMQGKDGVNAHLVDSRYHGFMCEEDLALLEDLGSENEDKEEPALIGVDEYGQQLKSRLGELVYSTKPLQRGVLLYGPPGTGKTTVIERLFSRTNMFLVTQPMAAGDFSKPYKGMPERIMQVLRERSVLLPWQVCGVSIDEIDALAPDRMASTQRAGESDLSFQSLILSVLGGNQNAPNLLLFGSTNRKEAMDAAFLRRVSIHIFVGLPTFEHRQRWIDLSFPHPDLVALRDKLAIATLGFSQDKMNMLRRGLNADPELGPLRQEDVSLQEDSLKHSLKHYTDVCLRICQSITIMYNIKLGGYSLPELLQGNSTTDSEEEGDTRLIGSEWMANVIRLSDEFDRTGPGPFSALTLLCDLGTCFQPDAVQIGYVILHPILDKEPPITIARYLNHFRQAVSGITGMDVGFLGNVIGDRKQIRAFLDGIMEKNSILPGSPEGETLSGTGSGVGYLRGRGSRLVKGLNEEWGAVLAIWKNYKSGLKQTENLRDAIRNRQTELFVVSAGTDSVSTQTYDDVVQMVVAMAIDPSSQVDYVQFFDATTLLDSSERVSEDDMLKHLIQMHATATSYASTILVFDLDCLGEASDLTGVNSSESSTFTPLVEEGIGSSSAAQFVSQRILFRVLRFFVNHLNRVRERRWKEFKTGVLRSDGYAHRYIAVSRHPEVTKAFKTQLRWMTAEDWKNFDQHEKDKVWTRCKHCFQAFKPSEATDGTNGKECKPHWGKLMYMPDEDDDPDSDTKKVHEREHAEEFDTAGPIKFEPRPLHWRATPSTDPDQAGSSSQTGVDRERQIRIDMWTREWTLQEALARLREVNDPEPVRRTGPNGTPLPGKPRYSVPNPKLRAAFKWTCCGQSLDDEDSPHWESARVHEPMSEAELEAYNNAVHPQ